MPCRTHLLTLFQLCVVAAMASPVVAAEHIVQITASATFNPSSLNIIEGDVVKWVNKSALIHTVTSGNPCTSNGIFNSGNLSPSQEFSFTFNNTGNFPYFCIPHCLIGMTGSVNVSASVPVETKTWGAIKAMMSSMAQP